MVNKSLVNVEQTPSTNICSIFFMKCCIFTFTVLIISGLGSACTFPRHLRTDAMWMAKYNDESTLNIYFKENLLIATRCDRDGNECIGYSRQCLVKLEDDKFQVQHTSKNEHNPTQYLCMQIKQRGKNIIQIRESTGLVYRTPNACTEQHLVLDNWPLLLTKKFDDQRVQCPFSGGYNVVFHTSDRNPKCASKLVPARLESECEQGDGITINFHDRECLEKDLEMDLVQNMVCETSWVHGNYTFIMLRSQTNEYKYWCMRIKGTDMSQQIHEGYLFIDLVCDPGDGNGNIRETSSYLYLEMERRIISSTCQDAYAKICSDRRVCESDTEDGIYKMHCRRSCNFCSGEEESCTFPGILRGDFLENTRKQTNLVTVDYYSMSISNTGLFRCHEPEGHDFENNTVLFQTFDNGCYPRFACFEVKKPASSILEYRLGNRVGWPIKHWDRLKDDVCADEMFEPNAKDREIYGKNIVEKPSKIVVDKTHHFPVNCELSSWNGLVDSRLYMQEEGVCDYCFIHDSSSRHTRDRLLTQPLNCTSGERQERRHYHCLGVFPQDVNTHAIVTRTLHLHQEYLCWVFVYENDNEERAGVVYVLEATHCNKVAINAVKEGILSPKRTFYIPKSNPRSCPYLPFDTTPQTHHPEWPPSDEMRPTHYPTPDNSHIQEGGENPFEPIGTTYYEPVFTQKPSFPYFTTGQPLYEMSGMNSSANFNVQISLLTLPALLLVFLSSLIFT
ncbi:Cilia and flagella associated protein 61 [Mactra antiquata]